MGCNCGGGGSQLANYEVKDADGKVVKTFTASLEADVKVFTAKNPGTTWRKTS